MKNRYEIILSRRVSLKEVVAEQANAMSPESSWNFIVRDWEMGGVCRASEGGYSSPENAEADACWAIENTLQGK